MKKWLSLILALTLVACCASAMAWGESNADLYENAIGLLKENKYTEAGKAFAALGGYSDSPRYTMYCSAIVAGEMGFYSTAVENLQSLDGFLDSKLLATYYAGLSWEAAEDYEKAAEVMSGITLYKDVSTRIASYPEKINARDYRKADADEQAGRLEAALSGFKALGNYQDSAARAEAVQEKINARDYAAADQYEQSGKLEEALTSFKALGSYRDSKDRAAAVQTKIDERAAAAAEQAKAAAYAAADQAEQDGDFATAYSGFVALGDYSDSAARAAAVQDKGTYAQALQYCMEGKFSQAYTLFVELGDYEDSQDKAYALGVTSFASVSDRGNGIAAFKFHDLWGLINTTTNAAVSPYWDEIGEFNRFGLARVSKDELFGYINAAGDVIVPCNWNEISEFNEDGLCTVATKAARGNYYYFGLYDSTGKEITPAQWRTLGNSKNSDWGGYYNFAYSFTPAFSEGKTVVQNADGLFGFIDTSGNLVGEVRWSSISNFSENLAVVVENNLYGFIDQNGQVVIEPQYADALSFSEGLAGVKKGGLWQFINHHNEVVIRPKFDQVSSFTDGKADVFLNGTGWQIIDSTGGLVYFVNEKTVAAYRAAGMYSVGEYVTFGHYPQTSEGNDNTPIEWLVLARDGNKALLLSRYGLDAKPYNEKYVDITWEKCTLRTWLNGTFLNKAFTTQEQKGILLTNVDNSKSQGYSKWSTNGGNNTQDRIFLLSYAEANKYLGVTYGDSKNMKSRIAPTAYAEKQGAYTNSSNKTAGGEAASWWLRSPGGRQDCVAYVNNDGSLNFDRGYNGRVCIRPALWIDLESGIF